MPGHTYGGESYFISFILIDFNFLVVYLIFYLLIFYLLIIEFPYFPPSL